ncbi:MULTISPECIES: NUDIX domain-containing protein [unclassified Micromonospora]|uniref:NUDIX domain-containing protein n=1 Tax=unclassified Micromonospora TaxID=2617518 RepID=UPI002FF276BC
MTDLRTYTDPDVYLRGVAEGWADPQTDPTRIDWPARQAAAAIPFKVVNGRPVNPVERTGIRYGRNQLGHWGEQQCADALVEITDADGHRWIVMIKRGDGHGWALPGGHVEPGETPATAAFRELAEETGIQFDRMLEPYEQQDPRYVPDPRASDEAWMVTHLVRFDMWDGWKTLPKIPGAGDDAVDVAWIRADSYADLARHLATNHQGIVFPAHQQMLADILGGPTWPTLRMVATIDGIALSDIGEDGDIVAVGHHDPRRMLTALRRYARESWGEALAPADPANPYAQIHHEWVVNTGDTIAGPEQEWCLESAPADAPGAFPVTRWYES